MTFDFDEDELDLLRRALDNYAAAEGPGEGGDQ